MDRSAGIGRSLTTSSVGCPMTSSSITATHGHRLTLSPRRVIQLLVMAVTLVESLVPPCSRGRPYRPVTSSPLYVLSSPTVNQFSSSIGESILDQVQWINKYQKEQEAAINDDNDLSLSGVGRSVYSKWRKWRRQKNVAIVLTDNDDEDENQTQLASSKEAPVWEALANLENDSRLQFV